MLSFMREVNDGNILNASDYGLENGEFWNIIEVYQDDGLIEHAVFATPDELPYPMKANLSRVRLTVKGMEYLNQHSAVMTAYKGLKEVRSWLPF